MSTTALLVGHPHVKTDAERAARWLGRYSRAYGHDAAQSLVALLDEVRADEREQIAREVEDTTMHPRHIAEVIRAGEHHKHRTLTTSTADGWEKTS